MNEPRDTIVGDALRRLDVPDHAPDFWGRLDASLSEAPAEHADTEDERAVDDRDAEVIELGAARERRAQKGRRSGRAPAVAAAAAAVAAIALAVGLPAAQQVADRDEQVDMAAPQENSSTSDPSGPLASDPSSSALTPISDVAPEELATEWLSLVRDGEVEAAYALLDEISKQALSLDAFQEVSTGLAEGAGAFTDLGAVVRPLIDDEGLAATAVLFSGDVERNGIVETAAYAVVITGDPDDADRSLSVAFTLSGPTVEAVQRTQPSETRTSPVELEVSPTAGATWALVDRSEPIRIDTGRPTIDVEVESIAGPGTHTVTVISTEAGLYTSRSFTVVVP